MEGWKTNYWEGNHFRCELLVSGRACFAHHSAAFLFPWPSNQGRRTGRIDGHTGSLAGRICVRDGVGDV